MEEAREFIVIFLIIMTLYSVYSELRPPLQPRFGLEHSLGSTSKVKAQKEVT